MQFIPQPIMNATKDVQFICSWKNREQKPWFLFSYSKLSTLFVKSLLKNWYIYIVVPEGFVNSANWNPCADQQMGAMKDRQYGVASVLVWPSTHVQWAERNSPMTNAWNSCDRWLASRTNKYTQTHTPTDTGVWKQCTKMNWLKMPVILRAYCSNLSLRHGLHT